MKHIIYSKNTRQVQWALDGKHKVLVPWEKSVWGHETYIHFFYFKVLLVALAHSLSPDIHLLCKIKSLTAGTVGLSETSLKTPCMMHWYQKRDGNNTKTLIF